VSSVAASVGEDQPARGNTPGRRLPDGSLGLGVTTLWLSVMVLLPLAALIVKASEGGFSTAWDAITAPQSVAALKFTVLVSLAAAILNAIFGTMIAWVLVRDEFPGKGVVNVLIDLPFALPTIVAGLLLLSLYGQKSPIGVDLAFTKTAVLLALLFVTLPFVIRSVQPVLIELDVQMEEAAASLGASPSTIVRRIILPNLVPAIVSGAALAFARAIGEFGSIVLVSGNIPFDTLTSPVYIFGQIESDRPVAAAAVSVVLLLISVLVLALMRAIGRWGARHAR